MLRSITIDNYKTFTTKTTIDFGASRYTALEKENVGQNKVLKGGLFIGENASGKTTILKAISFLIRSLSNDATIDFRSCQNFSSSKKQFSLEYLFDVDGHDVLYSITCDDTGYKTEKLTLDDRIFFYRKSDKIVEADELIQSLIPSGKIPHSVSHLAQLYFYTRFNQNHVLAKWTNSLKDSIYVNCYEGITSSAKSISGFISTESFLEENGVEEINHFMKAIHYNQKIDYTTKISNKNSNFSAPDGEKIISFEKQGTNTKIPLNYESTGNKVLISILPAFLYAIKHDSMLIVDDFSSGLHNELEECLIKHFFKNSKNSQLFLTTHSTNVLSTSLIRPDQVYTVWFDNNKGTQIGRLSQRDPMPRIAQNLEHMYLNGEFTGGIPRYEF